jgi:hypothetical protein
MPPTQIRTSYDRRLCLSLVSCMHTPESALYSLAKVIV